MHGLESIDIPFVHFSQIPFCRNQHRPEASRCSGGAELETGVGGDDVVEEGPAGFVEGLEGVEVDGYD